MEAVLAGGIGLAFGQLLDLFFERFYSGEPLDDPVYRCSSCKSRLRPVFLVPLAGFVWSLGRCPDCAEPLPLRALVLPIGGAALFVFSYLAFEDRLGAGLLGGFFATVFLALTITDLESGVLPNRIVYPAIPIAAALSWGWPDTSIIDIFAGGAAAVAIAAALLLLSLPFGAQAFGIGDVKMIVLIGFVVGLPAVIVAVFVGTLAGGAAAALLLLTRLRNRGDYIPHGPFLALGAVIALFWGQDIWDWYADR